MFNPRRQPIKEATDYRLLGEYLRFKGLVVNQIMGPTLQELHMTEIVQPILSIPLQATLWCGHFDKEVTQGASNAVAARNATIRTAVGYYATSALKSLLGSGAYPILLASRLANYAQPYMEQKIKEMPCFHDINSDSFLERINAYEELEDRAELLAMIQLVALPVQVIDFMGSMAVTAVEKSADGLQYIIKNIPQICEEAVTAMRDNMAREAQMQEQQIVAFKEQFLQPAIAIIRRTPEFCDHIMEDLSRSIEYKADFEYRQSQQVRESIARTAQSFYNGASSFFPPVPQATSTRSIQSVSELDLTLTSRTQLVVTKRTQPFSISARQPEVASRLTVPSSTVKNEVSPQFGGNVSGDSLDIRLAQNSQFIQQNVPQSVLSYQQPSISVNEPLAIIPNPPPPPAITDKISIELITGGGAVLGLAASFVTESGIVMSVGATTSGISAGVTIPLSEAAFATLATGGLIGAAVGLAAYAVTSEIVTRLSHKHVKIRGMNGEEKVKSICKLDEALNSSGYPLRFDDFDYRTQDRIYSKLNEYFTNIQHAADRQRHVDRNKGVLSRPVTKTTRKHGARDKQEYLDKAEKNMREINDLIPAGITQNSETIAQKINSSLISADDVVNYRLMYARLRNDSSSSDADKARDIVEAFKRPTDANARIIEQEILLHKGIIYIARDQHDEAIIALQRVVELQPTHTEPKKLLADELLRVERFDDAIVHVDQYLALAPEDVLMQTRQNYLYCMRDFTEEKYNVIVQRCTAWLGNHPDDQQSLLFRANAYLALQHSGEAIADFENFITASPDNAEAHIGLGNALMMCGKVEEGIVRYRHGLSLLEQYADEDLAVQAQIKSLRVEVEKIEKQAQTQKRLMYLEVANTGLTTVNTLMRAGFSVLRQYHVRKLTALQDRYQPLAPPKDTGRLQLERTNKRKHRDPALGAMTLMYRNFKVLV